MIVHVVSAKGMTNLRQKTHGISDPFCRVTVYPSLEADSCPTTSQTAVVYNSLNPEWDEANSWNIDWCGTKPSRLMRADPLPEASSGQPAWDPNKRYAAVVSAAGSKERTSKGTENKSISTDSLQSVSKTCAHEPHFLDPSDPEYVVQKMIAELQKEVEFWKNMRKPPEEIIRLESHQQVAEVAESHPEN